ncbi:energy transducer TonB [Brevundimonas sp.]|uniref:energy transducer TonB family protein n=1 Tax=Brevundimonas sp. TaxID=1871086 RepID=UPI0025D962C9|nr:energy transducer TonB [Brevundimonas sp.]
MMMAVANAGGVVNPLPIHRNKPLPAWAYGAIGISVLLHAAGAVWLYNQNFAMPEAPPIPERPPSTVTLWNPPEPDPEPVPETAPQRPTIATHVTPTPADPVVDVSPFPAPDTVITETAPIGGAISLEPLPEPTAGGTATEPTPPSVIRNPEWVRQPTARQLERAFPQRAANDGVSGRVTLSCSVTASGAVSGCSVASESPQGYGFGRAGLSLTQYFVMRPRTVDGAPVEGARVSIPLVFSLGD